MKKGIIRDVSERDLTEVGAKHVIIERDSDPCVNPVTDNDNLFYLHSNITREFCGNESQKGYPGLPVVEIEDEDGYGTGEYRPEEDAFLFPVAAYIHSGITLSLGSGSHFPDQRWDVTRNAAWLWTNKKRFCEFCGERNWMHVYDDKTETWRPAKDRDEFETYLRGQAESLLDEWQKWNDGEVYGYRTETSCVPYKRLYPDGHTEDEVDWVDGDDSCWGFIVNKPGDIDFPRGDGWEVFDATGNFVGDEYEIPEFVVLQVSPDGIRYYLSQYTKGGGRRAAHVDDVAEGRADIPVVVASAGGGAGCHRQGQVQVRRQLCRDRPSLSYVNHRNEVRGVRWKASLTAWNTLVERGHRTWSTTPGTDARPTRSYSSLHTRLPEESANTGWRSRCTTRSGTRSKGLGGI